MVTLLLIEVLAFSIESVVEYATLTWLESLGWNIAHGSDIAPDTLGSERNDCADVVLRRRPCHSLAALNLDLPREMLDDAFGKPALPGRADA